MNLFVSGITALLIGACLGAEPRADSPTPLQRAHAHNDYEHTRPLLDALDQGFCSIEADVYLVGTALLGAHDRDKVAAGRTLQSLYLDPLRERARQNGGRVYRNGPSVILLVDVKSEAESTYAALRDVLKGYADVLTTFSTGNTDAKAVTVVISGNRARKTMASEPVRYASLDGRLDDLKSGESRHLIPLVSDNWSQAFKWRGVGIFPADERHRLEEIVKKAHAQGRKVRFWATADQLAVWRELLAAGVDLINTDDLAGLKGFLVAAER